EQCLRGTEPMNRVHAVFSECVVQDGVDGVVRMLELATKPRELHTRRIEGQESGCGSPRGQESGCGSPRGQGSGCGSPRGQGSTSPVRYAMTVAWVRSRAPSLRSTEATWVRTVSTP